MPLPARVYQYSDPMAVSLGLAELRQQGLTTRGVLFIALDTRGRISVAVPDDLAHVAKVAQKVAKAAMKVFDADGITVQQFSEAAGGQVVFHLHVHVMPRQRGVALKPPASVKEDDAVLADHARRLAAALKAT